MSKSKKPGIPNRANQPPANGTVERIPNQNGNRVVASAFRGPLPTPSMLAEYDEVVPGLAKNIVQWTTDQTAHRQQIESRAVGIDEKLSTWYIVETLLGQFFAFLITLAVLVGVVYLAIHDKPAAAAALGAFGFGSIITAFIVGRKIRTSSEDQPKNSK